eukprot:NODE_639_length_5118_cov_0.568440.p4 type:complete len:265 gc:universal NODE_639_length_5118_cov_0.568440:2179-2973(+)
MNCFGILLFLFDCIRLTQDIANSESNYAVSSSHANTDLRFLMNYGYNREESDKPKHLANIQNVLQIESTIQWREEQCDDNLEYLLSHENKDKVTKKLLDDIARQLLEAFKYLHDLGLHYMNLRPANVIQCGSIYKLNKLENVGLYKEMHNAYLYTTVKYYAPRLYFKNDGTPINSRVWDITSFGKIMYQLLYWQDDKDMEFVCFENSGENVYFRYDDEEDNRKADEVLSSSEFEIWLKFFKYTMNCEYDKTINIEDVAALELFQ